MEQNTGAGGQDRREEKGTELVRFQPDGAYAAAVSSAMQGVLMVGYESASQLLQNVAPLLDEDVFQPSGRARVELIAMASRVANQANAALMRHAAALAADMRLEFGDRRSSGSAVGEEIGNALGIAPFTAGRWARAGEQVFGRLFETGELFELGDLTSEKVCVIAEMLESAPDPLAFAIQDEILPVAACLTPRQIKTEISRLLIELDPEGADERHARARQRRYVSRLRQAAHGMATFNVLMPADQAAAVNSVLEKSARAAKSAGDGRTNQELRADTLASLAIRALQEGHTLSVGDPHAIPPAQVNVTVPLEVAARAMPEWEGHPSPLERVHQSIMGEEGCALAPRDGRTEAAWLEGYGPIPPAVALMLASGGTWRRIITDPLNGMPLDVGRATYRPPTSLMVAVMLRDRTCSRPGCDAPAMYCDYDHLREWFDGGGTSFENIHLLCRRCHRMKSLGAGRFLSIDASGRTYWRSPLGILYSAPAARRERRFCPAERGAGAREPESEGSPSETPRPDPGPPPF
ncbi:MAG: DUF222 domain-containing protein [bacterium]|nr:DUF222 domain-containing protein [bacterium]